MTGFIAPRPVRLTHQEIEGIRNVRGRSMLLFITDRCPVGCAHCSVDSRRDSPTISDFGLFEEIVDWMCSQSRIEVVGISGGEPFAERRGLAFASKRFASAGKRLVVFTSGVWARAPITPPWIGEVLSVCSSIYLSTDAFHARAIEDPHFVRAAQAIAVAGCWVVVQVLDHGDAIKRVERLLEEAFGTKWRSYAETNLITPLASGRGHNIFTHPARVAGQDFGPCSLARSPMVRYDGLITGCCNESVIMGGGPKRLRQRALSATGLDAAVQGFHGDPLLRVIGDKGFGILTQHPRLGDLASQRFGTNCQLCWRVMERLPDRNKPDRLVRVMSDLEADA